MHRQSGPVELSELAVRRLGKLLAALVAGTGIWLLAGLLWGFSSPPAPPLPVWESRPQVVGERIAARALFASREHTAATPATAVDNWQLLGVTASDNARSARAIIRREAQAQPLILAIGDDLDRGIRLLRIEPEQVVLRGSGGEMILSLPRPFEPAPRP